MTSGSDQYERNEPTLSSVAQRGAEDTSPPRSSRAASPRSGGDTDEIIFGQFRLQPAQRQLLLDGKPVQLGSRALDILCLLIERAGEIVSKDDILARVWPNTYIADGNLRVHVAGLRKALGDGRDGQRFIVNVANRGYSFVAPFQRAVTDGSGEVPAAPGTTVTARTLPTLQTRVIGREQERGALTEQVIRRRLVTVVGAGGVGKTTFCVSLLTELLTDARVNGWRGVYFVDLASLADPRLVPSALASALGLASQSDDVLVTLMTYLHDKELLLLFDNCEHVIGAVAQITEAILQHASGVRVLATSREPLRIEGEWVYYLQPLAMPPPTNLELTVEEAMSYPAVELFVERANARSDSFVVRKEDVGALVEICHRLDGIPLALELAAGRVDVFGVRGLASALSSLFAVLTKGRRTALPRHQALHATLDWSFNLLSSRGRILLQRLSVFSGIFTLNSATAVAAWGDLTGPDVVEGISDLVSQSLVSADVSRNEALFRLLKTTRAYASEKLAASDDARQMARTHASHCLHMLAEAEAAWLDHEAGDWDERYGWLIDDVRASLDWAHSEDGDADSAVNLTVAAVPLWFQLSLINECRERVEQALDALRSNEGVSDTIAMKLHGARGWSLMYTASPARESGTAWAQTYELAERLNDTDYQLRALWGLWAGKMNNAEFTAARDIANRFCALAPLSADATDAAIGDRMMGASLHFLGDQPSARLHIERMLANYIAPPRRLHVVRYQFDPRVTAKITLARVLWLQGLADQAIATVDASIEEGLSIDHTLSLCNTIAQSACPVALLVGDLDRTERFADILLRETARHGLEIWHDYGRCFRGQILIRRGDAAGGLPLVQNAVEQLRRARFVQYYVAFLLALADGLAVSTRVPEAIETIDEALAHAERTSEHWAKPEMLRMKGECLHVLHGDDGYEAADSCFDEALALARQQHALSWQLRTATSRARLWRTHSHDGEAKALLEPIYSRFREGFGTTDLKVARELLDALG